MDKVDLLLIAVRGQVARAHMIANKEPGETAVEIMLGTHEPTMRDLAEVAFECDVALEFNITHRPEDD